jgi:beta-N-acetylhexosaminidase
MITEQLSAVQKPQVSNQPAEVAGATSFSFELKDPDVEEIHFVVRNSSTQALYGFCATYIYNGVGIIGAIFVDPTKRNLSIGHSLHQRAVRGLIQRREIVTLQFGTGLPSIYPGIPTTDSTEGESLMAWVSGRGWRSGQSRSIYSMIVRGLNSWQPPDALVKEARRVIFNFDLVHGGAETVESILEHVSKHSTPDIVELYALALQDASCGVVRAKDPRDGSLVGSVIICKSTTDLAFYVPALSQFGNSAVGIVAPVVSKAVPDCYKMLQGLVLLGIRQNKDGRSRECIISCVSHHESNMALGSLTNAGRRRCEQRQPICYGLQSSPFF